jgi:hypothetical protein
VVITMTAPNTTNSTRPRSRDITRLGGITRHRPDSIKSVLDGQRDTQTPADRAEDAQITPRPLPWIELTFVVVPAR